MIEGIFSWHWSRALANRDVFRCIFKSCDQNIHFRSRLYSFVTLISFLPNDPTLSMDFTPFSSETNAFTCVLGPGIQCAGFRFDVEEPLLVVLNLSRRSPMPSVGRSGRSRRQDGSDRTLGTQQQTMPTAISMGEKQMRHQDAPIASSVTLPKTSIAQSILSTARIVQLSRVNTERFGSTNQVRRKFVTYKHPRRKSTKADHFFLDES